MDAGKQRYTELLASVENVPLFAETWWLDATCSADGWRILEAGKEKAHLFMPYQRTHIRGLRAITTPPLTQFLPVLQPDSNSPLRLDEALAGFSHYSILDISIMHSLPVRSSSKKINISYRYSYRLDVKNGIENTRSNYNEGLRRNLKEAASRYFVATSHDVDTFNHLCRSAYSLREQKLPGNISAVITTLYEQLRTRGRGALLFALKDKIPVAGILTAWDNDKTYYILGGRSPDPGDASAHALLLDHAIEQSFISGRSFDFEGSMHPGIANFFQSFGATPEVLYRIRDYKGMGKIWALFQN